MTSKITAVGAALILSAAAFAESPLVGKWKSNPRMGVSDPKVMKIESDGNGGIRVSTPNGNRWGHGGGVKSSWVPIYEGRLDGVKRAGLGPRQNDRYTPKRHGERGFSVLVDFEEGGTQQVHMEVSPDEKTLTQSFIRFPEAGPKKGGVFLYNRVGGEGKPFPFVGEWKEDTSRSNPVPFSLAISENGGIFTVRSDSQNRILDVNKPADDKGFYAKRLGERSIEFGHANSGVRFVIEASPDGKTLQYRAIGTNQQGETSTLVRIYERQ